MGNLFASAKPTLLNKVDKLLVHAPPWHTTPLIYARGIRCLPYTMPATMPAMHYACGIL